MEAGEAQVDKMVNQLLSNERFVSAIQGVVSTTLAARGSLDKSLRSALNTMNLPSTADLADLGKRLDRLDRLLSELDGKMARLEKSAGATSAPATKKAAAGKKATAPAVKKASAAAEKKPAAGKKAAGGKASA